MDRDVTPRAEDVTQPLGLGRCGYRRTMANSVDHFRAIGSVALQAVISGAWVAAGELPAAKRRLARAATMVSGTSVSLLIAPPQDRLVTWTREGGFEWMPGVDKDVDKVPQPARSNAAALVAMTVAAGIYVGGRVLEKRWLESLRRAGHPHPHRALGLRMGLLSVAGSLGARAVTAYTSSNSFDLHRGSGRTVHR